MTIVNTFKATYYNASVVGDLSLVISPPYDVISPEETIILKKRSPYNFSHIILPQKKDDDYEYSKNLLLKWRKNNVLIDDIGKFFYVYRQVFDFNGRKYSRDTIMLLVRLGKSSDIRAHENTHGIFKQDRLKILRKTRMNLSHVFAVIEDKESYLKKIFERIIFEKPVLSAKTEDKIEHAIWRIKPSKESEIKNFFINKPLTIIDGHHRYLSALLFAEEESALESLKASSYMLFSVASSFDPSLLILPTHRAIRSSRDLKTNLENYFNIEIISKETLLNFVNGSYSEFGFALWHENQLKFCKPKFSFGEDVLEQIPTFWSDDVLLSKCFDISLEERATEIIYTRQFDSLFNEKEKYGAIIFHTPVKVELVIKVSEKGKFMPPKSTYFYPKLAAGLILRDISL